MKPTTMTNAIGIGAILCASLFGSNTSNAQSNQTNLASQSIQAMNGNRNSAAIARQAEPLYSDAAAFLKSTLDLTEHDELLLKSTKTDELGFTHYKYIQLYKGVKVDYRTVTLHVKDGRIKRYSSNFLKISQLSTTSTIDEKAALNHALSDFDGANYAWEVDANMEPPKAEMIIMHNSSTEEVHYTYKFDVYAYKPFKRAFMYVDASTGKVISKISRIHHTDVPASGKAIYQGNVNFLADQTGPSAFRLRQSTDSIETYSANNEWGWFNTSDITSSSANGPWNDSAAIQAHYGAEQTHDYFLTDHGRNSFDDQGSAIRSYVHIGVNYINAFWDGEKMSYGDGDTSVGPGYLPLVSLDIVGHEIAHGVTNYEANLIYQKESGALNESFSDIFGEAVERHAKGINDWQLGADIGLRASGAIRSMDNPKLFYDPDTYLGSYWIGTVGCIPNQNTNDLCGVHINSGVQNKWFYILSEGESGTNDNGDNYHVTGIGFDKAEAIAYRNLTVYLTPTSKFHDARAGAIAAAGDLYGVGSTEAIATAMAWDAVGVYGNGSSACAKSLYTTSYTASNYAYYGYFFDVTAVNDVVINDFMLDYFSFGVETDSIYVYTTSGSYTAAGPVLGWTYVGKAVLTSDPLGAMQPLMLNAGVKVAAGQTQAFAFYQYGGRNTPTFNAGLVSAATSDSLIAANPDLEWYSGPYMDTNLMPSFDVPNRQAVWGEICYDIDNSCPATSMSFQLYGHKPKMVNAGASNPNIFYKGISQSKRLRARITGGVGPFTYSFRNSEGYSMKHQRGSQIQLFEPNGPSWVICDAYDQGSGCTTTDSVFVDFSDEFYCGDANNYWQLKICKDGQSLCLPWGQAVSYIKAGTAVLGDCAQPNKMQLSSTSFKIYPNPSAGEFIIECYSEGISQGEVTVFDLNSRIVFQDKIGFDPGNNYLDVDLSGFTNGMYILKVSDNLNVYTDRIQIMK